MSPPSACLSVNTQPRTGGAPRCSCSARAIHTPFPPYPPYYLQPRQKPPTLHAIQGVEDRASQRPSLRKWHRTPSTPAATRSPRLGPKPSPRPNPSPLATANRTRTNWTNPWRRAPNTLKRRPQLRRSPAARSQSRKLHDQSHFTFHLSRWRPKSNSRTQNRPICPVPREENRKPGKIRRAASFAAHPRTARPRQQFVFSPQIAARFVQKTGISAQICTTQSRPLSKTQKLAMATRPTTQSAIRPPRFKSIPVPRPNHPLPTNPQPLPAKHPPNPGNSPKNQAPALARPPAPRPKTFKFARTKPLYAFFISSPGYPPCVPPSASPASCSAHPPGSCPRYRTLCRGPRRSG